MNNLRQYLASISVALVVASVFFINVPMAHAASTCLVAKLYSSSSCDVCIRIKKEAASSIALLVQSGRLEVIEIGGGFAGEGLPDLQIFDPSTKKMLELFQNSPLTSQPKDLVIRDASGIVSRLQTLAGQEGCNPLAAVVASSFEQVSARGTSSPIIDVILREISTLFSRARSGLITVVEYLFPQR